MNTYSRILGVSAIALAAFASLTMAQDGPAGFQQVVHFTIKPGMAVEFEGIMKQYIEAAEKQGVANRWWMFQQGAGGSPDHYHLVSTFDAWAGRDAWTSPREMFVKTHGEEDYTLANRRWSAAVASTRIMIYEYQPDLSAPGSGGGIANHYIVSLHEIRPEKVQDYRFAIEKIRAAQGKADGHPPVVARRTIEGNRWSFKATTGFNSGAERDAWPSFDEFMSIYSDQETEQIMDKLRESTVSSTWYEVNLRRDLSYQGPSGTTN